MTVDKLYTELMKLKHQGFSSSKVIFIPTNDLKEGEVLEVLEIREDKPYITLKG